MSEILEPIVLEPAGLTPEQGWTECKDYVEQCGGLTYPDGEVNWRAAFGADPGCCTCPCCRVMYWSWGTRVRCVRCGFEFETDWWPMYSYGVNAATAESRGAKVGIHNNRNLLELHERRLTHPYYRYGFDHPVADPWKEHDQIDWRNVLGGPPEGVR